MRTDEAEKIIEILLQCDGGCEYCVSHLINLFIANFKEHEEIAKKAFREKFGIEIGDFLKRSQRTLGDKK